jgi:outer membrane protein OmpA-like peptidoglycan-associated protein
VAQPTGPCLNSIDIRPDTATVLRGESVQFTATARTCAGNDTTVTVTYSGGNVDQTGRFTAGTDTGVVQITGTANVGGRALTDVANIRVVRMRSTIVNFDLNSAALDGGSRSRLDQLITALRANPRVTIRVEGHADTIPPSRSQGAASSRRYNERLSLARADSVTAYLLSQGVDRSRFEPRIRGYSFCAPAVPHRAPTDYEKDAQGRPLGERANRRVEIFELAMIEEEQVRWVCGGRAEPVTRATPGAP